MRPQWIAIIAEAGGRLPGGGPRARPASSSILPTGPAGWTVRQVIHHVPDSHMNCFIRFRLALTEDEPTIKPYDENKWSELHDSRTAPVEVSLQLLESLHSRWVDHDGSHVRRRFRAHLPPSGSGPPAA